MSTEFNMRYPIGKFSEPDIIDKARISEWINIIEHFPLDLYNEVGKLNETELNFKYRPGGWNITQIVHHCADSHMNSFTRFKLALTEDTPTIRPYYEDRWAELPDSLNSSIEYSLKILEGLHSRWTLLLKNLTDEDLDKSFYHPETGERITLRKNIGIYAWHCNHHLEHIRNAKKNGKT